MAFTIHLTKTILYTNIRACNPHAELLKWHTFISWLIRFTLRFPEETNASQTQKGWNGERKRALDRREHRGRRVLLTGPGTGPSGQLPGLFLESQPGMGSGKLSWADGQTSQGFFKPVRQELIVPGQGFQRLTPTRKQFSSGQLPAIYSECRQPSVEGLPPGPCHQGVRDVHIALPTPSGSGGRQQW